ncbi:MAG: HAMP domain-containing sensor histidine kinase [Synechococcaceae cyanobacterium]|nr:HAMP domain-containing sensor histidine kinase [Synechococcaceae cyanobacterium]
MIPVSERFLALLQHQLAQFADCAEVRSLSVYVTDQSGEGPPSLLPVGRWPAEQRSLPPVDAASQLRMPAEERRWLPLSDQQALLGALQVETLHTSWSASLSQRLQAVALCLTEALRLDREHQRLQRTLSQREEQLRTLVHQLRNPLTALRTFGQLLRRRLEHDGESRGLVEGLLSEESQLERYVEAIDRLARRDALLSPAVRAEPLLLPPLLSGPGGEPLAPLLEPLLQRAAATANLQGRPWRGPGSLPAWRGDSGAVAEIVANLLENAFRYSPAGCAVGLDLQSVPDGGLSLTVWDDGTPIAASERQVIFERGRRGSSAAQRPGSGLGLSLARDLARHLGGELELLVSPRAVAAGLPEQGNAFRLSLPPAAPADPQRPQPPAP